MVGILTLVPQNSKRIKELSELYFHKDEVILYHADDRKELLDILEKEQIDLALISNRNIPDEDMIDLVQTMQLRFGSTLIVVITRQEDRELAMKLYRLGMDEWITRPYDALEISLRCRALLRRTRARSGNNIRIGDVSVDFDRFEVVTDGRAVHLAKKEFLLLHLLLSNPEKVFTRAELMERVWGYDSDSDDATVAVHIGRIKKKLGEPAAFDIVPVRGVGYKAVLRQ